VYCVVSMRTPFHFPTGLPGRKAAGGGRTALVTGGAQGIGWSIADRLLNAGWNVAILDLREPAETNRSLLSIRADVSSEHDVEDAIRKTAEAFGGLHGLVNNAGIGSSSPIENLSLEEWNRVLGTNLTGTFLCSKYAVPHLRKSGGAIVNIASTRARQSEAHTEPYSASKGGIVALTHAMAVSLGPEIRVNCISPGWIETDPDAVHSESDDAQHPCGRVGTPADVAAMAEYLLSDRAGFITGQDFAIDGGMTKKMIYTD